MAIDGYTTNVDLSPAKDLISLQRRCVNNLSQIAKHVQTYNAYQALLAFSVNNETARYSDYKVS